MPGFFDDPANQPPSGGSPLLGPQQIIAWYQKYLGRLPTQEDIQTHLANPGGAQGAEQAIAHSPEAQAYALANPGGVKPPQTGSGTGGTGGFMMPQGDWKDPAFRRQAIIQGYTSAYGRAPDESTISYWDQKFPQDPAYFWERLLGKGAGGRDSATMGPYAGGQGGGPGGPGGFRDFTGFGGGDPQGFGAPPPPYQSQPSTVPPYKTPPLPSQLQTPFAPNALPRNLQTPYVLPAYNQQPEQPLVMMREPGGTTKAVPQDHVEHFKQFGAQVVTQGGQ